ncbi:MAG: hypothetical protein JRN21_02515 [Nitrososphaerota archaeon]|nr:hypothetical protein [Nitrososphaerota archaeon]
MVSKGGVEGSEESEGRGAAKVLRLTEVPLIKEPLKEKEAERLSLISSPTVRSLGVAFTPGKTDFLISSHSMPDLNRYLALLKSVYGELSVVGDQSKPAFLREIPRIVGLPTAIRNDAPSPSLG